MRAALLLAALIIAGSRTSERKVPESVVNFCAYSLLVFFAMDFFELLTIYVGVLK